MPSPAAVLRALIISAYYGLLFGGSLTIVTDSELLISSHPKKELFSTARFWVSSGAAMGLYLGFLPAFKWSFTHDLFRLQSSNWKMSLHTYIFHSFLYPLMVHLLSEILLLSTPSATLTRLILTPPSAMLLTLFAESSGFLNHLRQVYLEEFAFE